MTMPHDQDAERAVVGAVLAADVLPRVLALIDPTDMHVEPYRIIMGAMQALWEKDTGIDVVTLASELKAKGALERAGGFNMLGDLVSAVPTADNVEHHAGIVAKYARRREIIHATEKVLSTAHNGEDEDVSNALAALMTTAAPGKGGDGFRAIRDSVWDAMAHFDRLAEGDATAKGIQTGFRDLDNILVGLQPGDLVIVAARPSMGKTAFVLNAAVNVALVGIPVGIVSLEMRAKALASRMITAEARVDIAPLRNGRPLTPEASARMATAAGHIHTLPIFVDDHPMSQLPRLSAKVTNLVRNEGVRLVVIDYLQLMEGTGENRTQEVSGLSRGLKNLAGQLEVPIVVLSQLSRKVEERGNKRPMLSDLRESGSIEQDADVTMFLYRPEYYAPEDQRHLLEGQAELIVAKQRNGPIGMVPLRFHKEYARFDNA